MKHLRKVERAVVLSFLVMMVLVIFVSARELGLVIIKIEEAGPGGGAGNRDRKKVFGR